MVDMFEDTVNYLTIRVNGGFLKSAKQFQLEFSQPEDLTLRLILKQSCKEFGQKDKYRSARLYNKNGLELNEEDCPFMKANDILYVALDGEGYNYCAILDEYNVQEAIGQGGFGTVKIATLKEDNKTQVAVKFMDITELLSSADSIQDIYKEAQSLKKLKHKNIVELYHAFVEGKQLIMIMELASGGEVLEYVEKNGAMEEPEARAILFQIINAMQYCHGRGVVHRDLKLENVLFKDTSDKNMVKIIDFGISGVCTTAKQDKVDAGSIAYMPPECFTNASVTTSPALDVWAIGLMFYAMLYGTLPFYSEDESDLIQQIKKNNVYYPPEIPVTAEAKKVLASMLEKDPAKRLQLIEYITWDYYRDDDSQHNKKYIAAKTAHAHLQEIEEKKAEEYKLASDLNAMNLQAKMSYLEMGKTGTSSTYQNKSGSSPRVTGTRKKIKKSTGSSSYSGGTQSTKTSSTKHKKTTK